MTRAEWLAALRPGDPVVLKTPVRTYAGVAELIEEGRVWVVVEFRDRLIFSTWVDPKTGANSHTGSAIYPVAAETAQEAPQGAGNGDPLPTHCLAVKIDSRRDGNRLNGIS